MKNEKLDSITARIHAKSDQELYAELYSVTGVYWKACGEHNARRVKVEDFPKLKDAFDQAVLAQKETIWYGEIQALYVETMFACLRDIRREKRVTEFIGQVESIQEITEHHEA